MSAEPLLPFDELLAPIPGDDPAGEPIGFAIRAEMEEARKEVDPNDFDADDPLRPTDAKKADWKGIIKTAQKVLTQNSKDLLVAARLTEALTKVHGYSGFADSLVLLRRLVDECWDRIHPTIEDGDLEVRAGPFNWIGDDGRGARFPYTLRTVPLFQGDHNQWLTLRDWKNVQEKKGDINRDDYERAITAASYERCKSLVEEVQRCIDEMTKLVGVLNTRLGSSAPGMMDVRSALSEALVLLKQALSRKPVVGGEVIASPGPEGATGEGNGAVAVGTPAPARAMATRADIYARLREAADLLEQMEPHSPVPYLIRRAVALGSMPFPQMMRALMRQEFQPALVEMNRELGIREDDKKQQDASQQPSSSGW